MARLSYNIVKCEGHPAGTSYAVECISVSIKSRCIMKADAECGFLQMTLDEAEYQAHVSQVAEVLTQSHIQGVFEERLPLDWKAALQLGCTAVVAPQAQGRPLAEGFAPTELQASHASDCILCLIPSNTLWSPRMSWFSFITSSLMDPSLRIACREFYANTASVRCAMPFAGPCLAVTFHH